MTSKTIRFRAPGNSNSAMSLTPDWIIKFLLNPEWLAETHLKTPGDKSKQPKEFVEIRIRIEVISRKQRLSRMFMVGKHHATMLSKFEDPSWDIVESDKTEFSITWKLDEGFDWLEIRAPNVNGEQCWLDIRGNEKVRHSLKLLHLFCSGWVVNEGDKLIVTIRGLDEIDRKAEFDLNESMRLDMENDTSEEWHPYNYVIGPEGLTDDECNVYYPDSR